MKKIVQSMMKSITALFSGLIFTVIFLFLACAAINSQAQNNGKPVVYNGMCDASAAVALDENTFIVASDEDNDLRIYRRTSPDELQRIKLSEVFKGQIEDGNNLEIDIEGAARLGDTIFWIGSHGAAKNGKPRPARRRLFAIQVTPDGKGKFKAASSGNIYTELISDLDRDSRFKNFKLPEAMNIKPKDAGGLNIEGLAATPEGHLLIGFRNPLQPVNIDSGKQTKSGKALVVELVNPLEVIAGKKAKFAAPITLDLDGLGIRSLEYDASRRQYLIVAGVYSDESDSLPDVGQSKARLYLWSGKSSDQPRLEKNIELSGFNPEAAFFFPKDKTGFVELLSDDGKPVCSNTFRGLLQKF